ncbi:DUF4116 domain-containing protein [Legionella worsleiensis]|uniref:DUF4116 domain-containing protein n=1 Tax=Legionella worsleiensis TaxID=45076 RepID=A0A0W1A669_9GAMM|nr:DUF4116 domain-containing protein [Legionella worsleiensis]KTD76849.1 hypothetical protein Lwor_2074 [Legionella worsleiensis]STY30729.1 Uncharacterised protein [Legionella worsleiensis]
MNIDMSNRTEVLELMNKTPGRFAEISDSLKNDLEIVMKAVAYSGRFLEYVNSDVKKNKKIVLVAVKNDGQALKYADRSLQNNDDVVFAAVSNHGKALKFAGEPQKNNDKIVLAAVRNYGWALKYASKELQVKKELALAAVNNDVSALQYVDETLRNDDDIVRAALLRRSNVINNHIESLELTSDKDLGKEEQAEFLKIYILMLIRQHGKQFKYIYPQYGADREIVLAAIEGYPNALQLADESLKQDRSFLIAAVNENPDVVPFTGSYRSFFESYILFKNEAFALPETPFKRSAIQLFKLIAVVFADPAIDKKILKTILNSRETLLNPDASFSQRNQNSSMVKELLKDPSPKIRFLGKMMVPMVGLKVNPAVVMKYKCLFEFADGHLKNNRNCVLDVVKTDGLQLEFAPAHFKADRDIALAAVKQNPEAIVHVDASLAPFLKSYLNFISKQDEFSGDVRSHTNKLLGKVEEFFLSGQVNTVYLTKVLDKTYTFFNEKQTKEYASFIQSSLKNPSSNVQILGHKMMDLAVVILGVSFAMGVTGAGAVPAAVSGILGFGLFVVGGYLGSRESTEEKQYNKLIQTLTPQI